MSVAWKRFGCRNSRPIGAIGSMGMFFILADGAAHRTMGVGFEVLCRGRILIDGGKHNRGKGPSRLFLWRDRQNVQQL